MIPFIFFYLYVWNTDVHTNTHLLPSPPSGHTCALFTNGRPICFGARGNASGQLGTVYATTRAIASCTVGTCLPVSSAGFIVFSNANMPVLEVSAGDTHTCGKLSPIPYLLF